MSGTDDLARELKAALEALTDAQHEGLVQAGVRRIDIALGLVGVAFGHVVGERFEPHPDGKAAFVSPCRTHDPLSIESRIPASALRFGDLIDLVFWSVIHPGRWAVRIGAAECLGLIEPQFCDPSPVRIHRAPLGWLRSGCNGLVPLTHDRREIYMLLSQCVGGVIAEDEAHAAELCAALDHPWPRPTVYVEPRNVL